MDWIKIITGAGVSAVMLWFVIAKVIPGILAKGSEERTEQRTDFLGALEKMEKRAEKRETAVLAHVKESTAMGNAQAHATALLGETMVELRADINTNTDALRNLERQRQRLTARHEPLKPQGPMLKGVSK